MSKSFLRGISFALLFSLAAGFWSPPAARAEDDGSAGNVTIGLAVVVVVVMLVVAWQMDFDKTEDSLASTRDVRLGPALRDDVALVLTDWQAADAERSEAISGVGLRAWF